MPVISRLTFAWTGAFGALALVGAIATAPSFIGHGRDRISLPVETVELTARNAAADSVGGLRLAAPGQAIPEGEAFFEPGAETTVDVLTYPPAEAQPLPDDAEPYGDAINPDDVVITIAGSERRVTPVTAASLTPVRARGRPIPDPEPAMLRATPYGSAPKIAPDGRRAVNVYRSAWDGGDGAPRISLIVGGLGLNAALTERAIDDLPPEVSLAFAPYAKDLDFWTEKARKAGHEVIIELPMEGYSGNDALGAAGLLTERTPAENLQRLDWLMSRFGGYVAATNYLGGKLAAAPDAMAPILARLGEAGVGYIDDTGAAGDLAARAGVPAAVVNRVIPPAPDDSGRSSVRVALATLETAARREGAVLAKTYAYAATIDEIITWSDTLDRKDLSLAPASAALPSRYASR